VIMTSSLRTRRAARTPQDFRAIVLAPPGLDDRGTSRLSTRRYFWQTPVFTSLKSGALPLHFSPGTVHAVFAVFSQSW
ncbi:MAG: hypothetical protein JWM74_4378, partial [Myxococcaceae bacterium]|nr:hypothetical protein [Myxococcaceae bacterium]